MSYTKAEQLYEGKAKKVFAIKENPDYVMVSYKDDATAFNGLKKGQIHGKGVINNKMTNYMFSLLEKEGIPTHLVEEINDRETVVKKVEIVPLEVIVRNVAAGSFSKKLGIEEGTPLKTPTLEFSYKNDDRAFLPSQEAYVRKCLRLCVAHQVDGGIYFPFQPGELCYGLPRVCGGLHSALRDPVELLYMFDLRFDLQFKGAGAFQHRYHICHFHHSGFI